MTTLATDTVRVYDPTGHPRNFSVQPAERPRSLDGLRPGILVNRTTNARTLLETMMGEVAGRVSLAAAPVVESKPSNGPPLQRMVDNITRNADFALLGTANLGSCTAWSVHAAIVLEQLGIPTVNVTTPAFVDLLRLEAQQRGLPDLRYVVVSDPIGGLPAEAMTAKAQAVTDKLIEAFTQPYVGGGSSGNGASGTGAAAAQLGRGSVMLDVPADAQALRREFARRTWSDGLPIIAPTKERVEAMLEYCERDPLEVLGVIAPRQGEATVQAVAVCAVMAGCEPKMFPALVAAVQGISRPEFNISGVNATTHPNTVMMLLNGPLAHEMGAHSDVGLFGPTFETNATLGRALRFVQLSIGGATPGHGDRATQGTPAKFTFCFAENEAESPWPPFQTTCGFTAEDSTVTVYACEGPHNIQDHGSNTGLGILQTVVGSMGQAGSHNILARGDTLLALTPEHAAVISGDGWDRKKMQEYIFELARFPADDLSEELIDHINERIDPDTPTFVKGSRLEIAANAESIHIVVAGGPGKHSSWMPGFGDMSYPQTVAIANRNGKPVGSLEELRRR